MHDAVAFTLPPIYHTAIDKCATGLGKARPILFWWTSDGVPPFFTFYQTALFP
jgi:hypothetical protein